MTDPRQIPLFDLPPPTERPGVDLDALLPDSMRTLIESGAAFDTVKALLEKLGGCVVEIPKFPREDHHVVRALGIEKAKELAQLAGGVRISVPRCHKARLQARNEAIRRDYGQDVSLAELVRRYELTERQVWSVLGSG